MDREDQHAQDARVEKLWHILDTCKRGQLSLNDLKKGLAILDHRKFRVARLPEMLIVVVALKNADSLLKDVLKAVDTDGDGHIQYSGASYYLSHSTAWLTQGVKSFGHLWSKQRNSFGSFSKALIMIAMVN